MTAPDFRARGLDPAHILSVTSKAIPGRGQAGLAIASADGVRVCFRSRRTTGQAGAALARVGYQVTRTDGGQRRDLLVTGWNTEGLESRLEAMRTVLSQLSASPSTTAALVIERFRSLPPGSPARRDSSLLATAHAELFRWVADHCGIHAPHDPAIMPADVGNALRLRAAWALENAIDDLVERHLRVAGHALPLYQSLRLQTTEDQAKDTAIRRASVTYHLSTSAAQEPSAPGRQTPRPPGPGPRSPGPASGAGPAGTAAGQEASGFPGFASPPWPLSQPGRADGTAPAVGPARRTAPVPRRPPRVPNPRRQRR
jgi:hypothetical protein